MVVAHHPVILEGGTPLYEGARGNGVAAAAAAATAAAASGAKGGAASAAGAATATIAKVRPSQAGSATPRLGSVHPAFIAAGLDAEEFAPIEAIVESVDGMSGSRGGGAAEKARKGRGRPRGSKDSGKRSRKGKGTDNDPPYGSRNANAGKKRLASKVGPPPPYV